MDADQGAHYIVPDADCEIRAEQLFLPSIVTRRIADRASKQHQLLAAGYGRKLNFPIPVVISTIMSQYISLELVMRQYCHGYDSMICPI